MVSTIEKESTYVSQLQFISDFDDENSINCILSEPEFKYKEG